MHDRRDPPHHHELDARSSKYPKHGHKVSHRSGSTLRADRIFWKKSYCAWSF